MGNPPLEINLITESGLYTPRGAILWNPDRICPRSKGSEDLNLGRLSRYITLRPRT